MSVKKKSGMSRRPGARLTLKVLGVFLGIAAFFALVWLTHRALFQGNPNLTLKTVVVRSAGWWRGRTDAVSRIARLKPGDQNIFSVDLAKVREAVLAEPSVKDVKVSRILPDILVVDIVERVPRAFLYVKGNAQVLDDDCVVMTTDQCVDVPSTLPVVTGFRAKKDDALPGRVVKAARPAIDLLDRLMDIYPDLEVRRVSLSNPDYFDLRVFYPGIKSELTLYLDRGKLASKLSKLGGVLSQTAKLRPDAQVVDMRCDGQVVVQ